MLREESMGAFALALSFQRGVTQKHTPSWFRPDSPPFQLHESPRRVLMSHMDSKAPECPMSCSTPIPPYSRNFAQHCSAAFPVRRPAGDPPPSGSSLRGSSSLVNASLVSTTSSFPRGSVLDPSHEHTKKPSNMSIQLPERRYISPISTTRDELKASSLAYTISKYLQPGWYPIPVLE
ncbi:hypothetical protein FA13DRAFT_80217 [Coprinellus micaceus]|uniref:Uncharacterized protein n=1 Tax=Coprinellus micaceus TaxID=71717 RepID=A0A4Y7TJF1_COPMI|nr:hypothetical protein FA13DRAFT_80217 [Coprinellus micaceus]